MSGLLCLRRHIIYNHPITVVMDWVSLYTVTAFALMYPICPYIALTYTLPLK